MHNHRTGSILGKGYRSFLTQILYVLAMNHYQYETSFSLVQKQGNTYAVSEELTSDSHSMCLCILLYVRILIVHTVSLAVHTTMTHLRASHIMLSGFEELHITEA